MPPTSAKLAAGTRIGAYVVIEHAFEGGQADVYKAQGPNGLVALKLMKPGAAEVQARFLRDLCVAPLACENVVRVMDHACHGDVPYIVMEWLEGHTLRTLIADGKNFEPRQLHAIVEGIANGLAALHGHQRPIAHRDISPANVIVVSANGRIVPKIIDFGSSREESRDPNAKRVTARAPMAMALGTEGYRAPELVTDSYSADFRADLFSFAALIFALLAREPPKRAAVGTIKNLEKVDPRLHAFFERALANDPGNRFPSARLLEVALARELRGMYPGAFQEDLQAFGDRISLTPGPTTVSTVPSSPDPAGGAPNAPLDPSSTSSPGRWAALWGRWPRARWAATVGATVLVVGLAMLLAPGEARKDSPQNGVTEESTLVDQPREPDKIAPVPPPAPSEQRETDPSPDTPKETPEDTPKEAPKDTPPKRAKTLITPTASPRPETSRRPPASARDEAVNNRSSVTAEGYVCANGICNDFGK